MLNVVAVSPGKGSVLFFSCPQSEGWPHHGRTFSILTHSSTGSPVHVLMLSIQAMLGLPRLRAPTALFLAFSLSPGNSLVSSWCDHTMLASLL